MNNGYIADSKKSVVLIMQLSKKNYKK